MEVDGELARPCWRRRAWSDRAGRASGARAREPGLGGASATATLYGGLQIILPGEEAPSHHHTPSRAPPDRARPRRLHDGGRRQVRHGAGRPHPHAAMHWHDHGHEGTEPVMWLTGSTSRSSAAFEANWASPRCPPGARDRHRLLPGRVHRRGAGAAPLPLRGEATRRCAGRGRPCGPPSRRWPRTAPSDAGGDPLREPADGRLPLRPSGAGPLAASGRERLPRIAGRRERVYQVIEGPGREPHGRRHASLGSGRHARGAPVAVDHAPQPVDVRPGLHCSISTTSRPCARSDSGRKRGEAQPKASRANTEEQYRSRRRRYTGERRARMSSRYESLMDVIRSRMTNRAFAPAEIPREHVEMILEAARDAPSGANALALALHRGHPCGGEGGDRPVLRGRAQTPREAAHGLSRPRTTTG